MQRLKINGVTKQWYNIIKQKLNLNCFQINNKCKIKIHNILYSIKFKIQH